jgi:ATP-dependent Clp protease ATP-binding subunit ClpA
MMKIVGKFLLELKNQVTDKSVTIDITDPALDYLVDKGFDPKMGARPLHRIIDQKIKNPLSKKILFGELRNGGHLTIDVADDNMILSVKETVHEEVPN